MSNQEPVVWILLEDHFINEKNIRSINKSGKQTIIEKIQGENLMVNIEYEKVKLLLNNVD